MQSIFVNVKQGRGTSYELGHMLGKWHKGTILYESHKQRRKKSLRSYPIQIKEARKRVEEFAPHVWEELEGISDGMKWRLEDVVHEYSGYQGEWKKSGCSALMAEGFYARNYDYHPKTYDGRFLLWQPSEAYASIGFAQRLIGRMDGMNEKGLSIGYHFVHRKKAGDGFICCSIARFILDTCQTTEEAVEVLRNIPHRHSFNYTMNDKNDRAAIVEASPRGVNVSYGRSLACSNHFRAEELQDENRRHLVESKERLAKLEEALENPLTPYQAFELFNHTDYPFFKRDYRNSAGTIHSSVYAPKTGRVYIGVGENRRPVIFSFYDWIKGQKNVITKIKGEVDTNLDFPHLSIL